MFHPASHISKCRIQYIISRGKPLHGLFRTEALAYIEANGYAIVHSELLRVTFFNCNVDLMYARVVGWTLIVAPYVRPTSNANHTYHHERHPPRKKMGHKNQMLTFSIDYKIALKEVNDFKTCDSSIV